MSQSESHYCATQYTAYQYYHLSATSIQRTYWWCGVVVTRLIRSAKLLYAGPG